jgi:hypothetical protein
MARTLIGQLILKLRTEGLGEAGKLTNVMRDVENAAKRLGQTGARSWGMGFQNQIDKLKLTQQQIRDVERSWVQLHQSMSGRNLARAAQASTVSHWKTNTLSHLAQQRAAFEEHFRRVEAGATGHSRRMHDIMRAAYVSMGFYTGAYGGGMVIRQGFKEASERSRVEAENKFRGLSDVERTKIDCAAGEIAGRRRVSKTDAMEVAADASMNMPSTDAALATLDSQISAFKLWANTYGSEYAIGQLRAFNRAMDNINVTEPDAYKGMLNNFMKAWQVTGKDSDPADWAQAIKYSRASGKVFSHDFLSRVLPFIMAETGGSDAGTQLRAGFDQFIVGRAPKNALKAQREYGLRDDDGLVQAELFAQNPMQWFHDVLVPAMKAKGVNTDDPVTLAEEIGKLTNNRLSSDSAVKAILGWEQMQRLLNERFPKAAGLKAADQMDAASLSSSVDGLVTSFGNLSAALIPVQSVINPALNSLADGINALAAAAKEDPVLAALELGLGGAALYGGAKYGVGKMADIAGLRASAVALDGSAAALTRAAVALGGAGVTDGVTPDGKVKRGKGLASLVTGGVAAAGVTAAGLAASLNLGQSDVVKTEAELEHDRYLRERLTGQFKPRASQGATSGPFGELMASCTAGALWLGLIGAK